MRIKTIITTIATAIIGFLPLLSNAQTETFYDGIDSANGIGWKYTQTLYPDFAGKLGIKKSEHQLEQSDYIIILSCRDSTLINTIEWIAWKEYREKVYKDIKRINIEQRSTSNGDPNNTRIDTIYLENPEFSTMNESFITWDRFFELKTTIVKPNSGDSTIYEFYPLEEVTNICITEYYFRSKSIKAYYNGKPNGTWMYFNVYGELTRKTEYELGVTIKDEEY